MDLIAYNEYLTFEKFLLFEGKSRHPQWKKVRDYWLLNNPNCAACGTIENCCPHHIKPYWKFPELELDEKNLITLCNKNNCHFYLGHLLNWRAWNENIIQDAFYISNRIKNKVIYD